eukprot:CAMPEP_0194173642 /NCGR_PEP_ID=MMETSP0154-20130528/7916_1 /TAXON_ID=1049557 /ORGANISM="Thalassiothrix antarctica, Strain L6-D1" /LENGTH=377 /DNA_ID=CAMNT_0038886755 /DNA_START=135 /DNA_END=1268 /DNA_ORIENTATION=-
MTVLSIAFYYYCSFFSLHASSSLVCHAFQLSNTFRYKRDRSSSTIIRERGSITLSPSSSLSSSISISQELLEEVKKKEEEEEDNDDKIINLVQKLEEKSNNYSTNNEDESSNDRFKSLIGLYEVSYIKSKRQRDNPVGGKWTRKNSIAQKLLRTRRTFQHILPANTTTLVRNYYNLSNAAESIGESINVISLEAFWGWIRLTVILRGDAIPLTLQERTNTSRVIQPLTSRAVKALFDPPRIVLGKTGKFFNINVGPTTSVLLDTLYCDEYLRIGMGGTSGTRFVFKRCLEAKDEDEAKEFIPLLNRRPTSKRKALSVLGTLFTTGLYVSIIRRNALLRVTGGILGLLSFLLGSLIATSTGGIEQGDRSVEFRKEETI